MESTIACFKNYSGLSEEDSIDFINYEIWEHLQNKLNKRNTCCYESGGTCNCKENNEIIEQFDKIIEYLKMN